MPAFGALVAVATAAFAPPPAPPAIAFSYAGGIELMRPDGSGVVRVTDPPGKAWDSEPPWSPDGSQLAFVRSIERRNSDGRHSITLYVQPGAGDPRAALLRAAAALRPVAVDGAGRLPPDEHAI